MFMRGGHVVAIGLILSLAAPVAAAEPAPGPTTTEQTFLLADELFAAGRYQDLLAVLQDLNPNDLSHEQQIDRLKRMAYTLYLLSLYDDAKQTWRGLLAIEPDYALDPVNESPVFVSFFARVTPDGEPPGGAAATVPSEALAPKCEPWLCLVPFGVGQFANGHHLKGAVFAGAEVAFLAANIGIELKRRADHDAGNNPSFSRKTDKDRARLQNVFLGLFVGTAVLGIVDAYLLP